MRLSRKLSSWPAHSIPNAVACPAGSLADFINAGVFRGKFVAIFAMSLGFFSRGYRIAAKYVLATCYNFQMHRINTWSIAAKMVKRKTIRYWTNIMLIGQSVSVFLDPFSITVDGQNSITILERRCPDNATVEKFLNFAVESFQFVGIHNSDFTTVC